MSLRDDEDLLAERGIDVSGGVRQTLTRLYLAKFRLRALSSSWRATATRLARPSGVA